MNKAGLKLGLRGRQGRRNAGHGSGSRHGERAPERRGGARARCAGRSSRPQHLSQCPLSRVRPPVHRGIRR